MGGGAKKPLNARSLLAGHLNLLDFTLLNCALAAMWRPVFSVYTL